MFFKIDKLRKNVDALYASLTKEGGIPKDWWKWDSKAERIYELCDEDENLIEDISALYAHAKLLKKNDLLHDIEKQALKLKEHLSSIKGKIDSGDMPSERFQKVQRKSLERIIHKLQVMLQKAEDSDETPKELRKFLAKHTVRSGLRHYFVFYRAEHIADRPALKEDSSGQFGKGVYFAASADVAKRFRSNPGSIFAFRMDPKEFIVKLRPIFISREDIRPFEHLDPKAFHEHLLELGYSETSYCVIGPIPDMGYIIQIMIDKDMLDELIDEGSIRLEKKEDFNI